MSPPSRFWMFGTLTLFAALRTATPIAAQETSDPFPIRRILLPADRIPAELEKLNQGPTVVVPYDELQRRLAAANAASRKESARLVKATYTAELTGHSLTNGRSQWTIRNPNDAAWMPLPRFGLAVSKPRLDGNDAILGESAGQPGMWLDRPGSLSLTFDWSLRGNQSEAGLAFEFVLPPAPVTQLELRVPANMAPASSQSFVLLSGPFDSESPKIKIWRLQTTGKGTFEVLIRPTTVTAGAGAMITAVQSVHLHQPAVLLADFDWQIDVLHHPVQELVFEVDGRLQPYDVALRGPEVREWQTIEEKRDKGPAIRVLIVRFRDPFVGSIASCKVKAWMPTPAGVASNPGMRLRNAVGRGEKLVLQLHPDLQLETWEPGRFRLAESAAASDQSLVLTLHDSAPNGPLEGRPRYEVRTQDAAFAVTEASRWRLGANGQSLDLDLRYDVSRGKLFQLALQLPAGAWKAAVVRTEPPELLKGWTLAGPALLVDLRKGIDPRTDARLIVSLQSELKFEDGTPLELDFPEFEPLAAALRAGSLGIEIDPMWNGLLLRSSMPPEGALADSKSGDSPSFRFAYRQEKLKGRLRISPRAVRPIVRLDQETTLLADKQSIGFRAEIEPIGGMVRSIDLAIYPPLPPEAVWRGGDIHSAERVSKAEAARIVAGCFPADVWQRLAAWAVAPPSQIWRVRLGQPTGRRTTTEWSIDFPVCGSDALPRASLPIAVSLGAEAAESRFVVRSPDASLTLDGVWGAKAPAQGEGDPGVVALLFSAAAPFGPRLNAKFGARTDGVHTTALIDDARLRVAAAPGSPLSHHLTFRVHGWKEPTFPLWFDSSGLELLGVAIDGHWLSRPEVWTQGSKTGVRFPAPEGRADWRCEVAYLVRTPVQPHALSMHAPPVEPHFPAAVTELRRQWRLPPDWLPLHQESFSSWHRRKPGLDGLRSVWTWGSQWLLPRTTQFDAAYRALVAAETGIRRTGPADQPIAEVLEKIAGSSGTAATGILVIDLEALRELGLGPSSNVPASAWSESRAVWGSLGLIARPVGAAALLTSPTREARLKSSVGDAWPDSVMEAVQEAAQRGQDTTGEFQALDAWILEPANTEGPMVLASLFHSNEDGWTEWRPLAGGGEPVWTAVSLPRIRLLSWILGGLLALVGWRFRRMLRTASRFRALWLLLCALLFGSFWLPLSLRDLAFAPIMATVLLLAGWNLSQLGRKAGKPTTPHKTAAKSLSAAIALAAALVTATVAAQAPGAFVILLPMGEADTAYVPTELLRKLKDLEAARSVSIPSPVVVAASYDGKRHGDAFDFDAKFDVHAFGEKAEWTLPLSGVDLKPGILMDGAPTFPSPAPKGYVFSLPRKGTHRITLSFVARVTQGEGREELRFGIPSAWSAQVQLSSNDLGRGASLVRCVGEDVATTDGKGITTRIKAELGPEPALHLRWNTDVTTPAVKTTIRERYLWDLRPSNHALTGILAVEPGRPGLTKFELQLPPNLETRSIEVQSLAKSPVPLSKGWKTFDKGNGRWISIELNQTVAAPFRIVGTWIPTFPVGSGSLDLRLPFPASAALAESLLAYRVDGFDVSDRARNLGITPLTTETFAKLWTEAGGKDAGPLTKAYSFGREAGQAVQGGLEVALTPNAPAVQAELEWTVHANFADLIATVVWTSTDDLALLKVLAPGDLNIIDVQGAHVHRWARQGETVNIWLSQARKQATARILGWRRHQGGNEAVVSLPPLRYPARFLKTQVKASASAGLAIGLERANGIKMQLAKGVLSGTAESPSHELVVRTKREPQSIAWRLLTLAEIQERRGILVQHAVGTLSHGDVPAFDVIVHGGPEGMRLDLGGQGTATRVPTVGAEQRWRVKPAPGTGSRIAFVLRGEFEASAGMPAPVPETRFSIGQVYSELVLGSGLAPTKGWNTVKRGGKELAGWKALLPTEWPKDSSVWARVGDDPSLWKIASAARLRASEPLSGERRWDLTEQGTWICSEEYLVSTNASKRIEAEIPPQARLLEVRLDGRLVAPFRPTSSRLRLDAESRGINRLSLRWRLSEEREEAPPAFAGTKLLGGSRYPVRETIGLPPRWSADEAGDSLPVTWLLEARAMLEVSRRLLETPTDPLAERGDLLQAQDRLRSALHWAKARLTLEGGAASPDLLDEWKHVGEENASLVQRFALDVGAADTMRSHAGTGNAGLPLRRHTLSDAPLPTLPLHWRRDLARPNLWTLQALLLGFVGVLAFSLIPGGLQMWLLLWPEQMLLLLVAAMIMWGVSPVGLVLVVAALSLRGILAYRAFRGWISRRTAKPIVGQAT